MIEKLRVSLWDIFTFFLSGFLLALVVIGHMLYLDQLSLLQLKAFLFEMPNAQAIFIFPVLFTLAGMLLEPTANYFDSWGLSPVYRVIFGPTKTHSEQVKVLKKEICEKHLGTLNGKLDDPYHFCKEYVETKQLSTTFMVFLSRYGFYRNVAFLCCICGVAGAVIAGSICTIIAVAVGWLLAATIFKHRSEDFYSYMAPSVYSAYLIDKIEWRKPSAT